jgi:hypothetical protein
VLVREYASNPPRTVRGFPCERVPRRVREGPCLWSDAFFGQKDVVYSVNRGSGDLACFASTFSCIYPCHQESIIIRGDIGSVAEVSDGICPIIYAIVQALARHFVALEWPETFG